MTGPFPFGRSSGDDEEPQVPEFMKAMFGGDMPPELAAMFDQLRLVSQGAQANDAGLRIRTGLAVQAAESAVELAEAELAAAGAEVDSWMAEQLPGGLAETKPEYVEAKIAAATKRRTAIEASIPALKSLLEVQQREAELAFGARAGELMAQLFGQAPPVRGDDVIQGKKKGQPESGDKPDAGTSPA